MKKIQLTLMLAAAALSMKSGLAAAYPYQDSPQDAATAPGWDRTAPPAPAEDPHERGLMLGGPRFGMSYITGSGFDTMKETVAKAKPGVELQPYMTQFGWHLEYRMFKTSQGLTALTELVPLVGGMDQGIALPSVNWLIGMRGAKGFEVGVGPNISVNGVAMMLGIGRSFDVGGINVPLNFAVGRTTGTTSLGISTGFNL